MKNILKLKGEKSENNKKNEHLQNIKHQDIVSLPDRMSSEEDN